MTLGSEADRLEDEEKGQEPRELLNQKPADVEVEASTQARLRELTFSAKVLTGDRQLRRGQA